jgi:hypothetical protein
VVPAEDIVDRSPFPDHSFNCEFNERATAQTKTTTSDNTDEHTKKFRQQLDLFQFFFLWQLASQNKHPLSVSYFKM